MLHSEISIYICLQIVNIIDDKNRAAIGAASETSVAGGGANDGSGVIRGRDGSDVQVSEANLCGNLLKF